MIGKEIVEKRVVSIAEMYHILAQLEGDLTYEQKVSKEYAEKIDRTNYEEAREKINKLVEAGLDEELAVKIVNVMPKTAMELHTVLAKEKEVSEDLYDKILEIIK